VVVDLTSVFVATVLCCRHSATLAERVVGVAWESSAVCVFYQDWVKDQV
jgi:hypothetical protein